MKPLTVKDGYDVVHEVVQTDRLLSKEGRLYHLACYEKLQLYWQKPRRRNVTCIACLAEGP